MESRYEKTLLGFVTLCLVLSFYHCKDPFTWFMEILPIAIGFPILIFTFPKFRFTRLVYTLVALHAVILMVGGHYTYAEVPLGFWIKDLFHFSRNHYDRIGHFAQGFIPALIARELLIRKVKIPRGGWLFFIVLCICMAISEAYEFLEWWTSLATGEAADAFLGTQGDVWDTQWDMFMATVGAVCALLTLSRFHNKEIMKLGTEVSAPNLEVGR